MSRGGAPRCWRSRATRCVASAASRRRLPRTPTDAAQLDRLVADVERAVGVPDILVNAQGVLTLKNAEDYDEADYDRIMGTNLKSVWFASTKFGRKMLARGSRRASSASPRSRRSAASRATASIA